MIETTVADLAQGPVQTIPADATATEVAERVPRGGRRGAGDVLYREDTVLAQTALRHRSIETTKDSYSYIEAGQTASRAGTIFENKARTNNLEAAFALLSRTTSE